jgi:thiol-disulfide isomerase/thioredoxin
MRISKTLAAGFIVAILALGTGIYIGMESQGVRSERAPEPVLSREVLAHFFSLRLNDADGNPQSFSQWQGKTLVINFWATWCPPCREEMPAFARLQTKYAPNDVKFVGIALDNAGNVTAFSKQHLVTYPLIIAEREGGEITRQLGNSRMALPYTVVLGPGEETRLVRLGRVSEQELDVLLQTITARK